METQKSLKKNVALNVAKSLMGIIFPLISFPYASRILLPDGIGKVNFANSLVDYFLIIASLGITTYATREASGIKNDKEKLSIFFKEIFFINVFSSLISIILFCIPCFLIESLSEYRILLIICAVKILFTAIGIEWFFIAKEEFTYITFRSIFFQGISLLFLFVFVRNKSHFLRYAALGVFSVVGSNLCNFLYAKKFLNLRNSKIKNIKRHIKSILIFFGSSCAAKIQNAIDSLMLGFLLGNVEVGFYAAATKLVKIVGTVLSTITATLLPRTSFYIEKKSNSEYYKLVQLTINFIIYFSIPSCMGLFILAKPLLICFCGSAYIPAENTMKIITPTLFFAAIGTLVDTIIFVPQKKEKYTLIFQIINCILNIVLNIYFIAKYGVFGAAFSTMLVELLNMILKILFSLSFFLNKTILCSFIKSVGSALTMYFGLNYINIITGYIFVDILLSTLLGIIIYRIITILLKHETATLIMSSLIRKIKGRFL